MNKNQSLLLILVAAVTVFLYKIIFSSRDKRSFLDEIRDKDIQSVVTKKYMNYENHNIPFLVYGKKDSIVIYSDWWDRIWVGDSIIKPKGSLELVIKSKNKTERLDYKDKFGLDN